MKEWMQKRSHPESLFPEVMSVRELAEFLRISVHTAYRLAEQGRLPGRKVGKHWRFHRQVIVEWLATCEEEDALYSSKHGGTDT
jgi:excisionase family DNA binding protein